jgi:hypothetical protein
MAATYKRTRHKWESEVSRALLLYMRLQENRTNSLEFCDEKWGNCVYSVFLLSGVSLGYCLIITTTTTVVIIIKLYV